MPPRQPSETCLSDKIGPQLYTRGEVARHNSNKDMWVIVDDKVYDITTWAKDHPGGRDILNSQAGRDATDSFYNFHHTDSIELLPNFYIGDLEESDRHLKRKNPRQAKIDEILRDYRELTDEMRRLGYFNSSKLYYSWKVATHFIMLGVFVALLAHQSWASVIAASFVAALFYSQNGWLSHDFFHNQVFENRKLNNGVGIMLGGLFQGFSSAWWKNKHNTHHASSNELDNDPDIDQLPLLSFHPVLLRGGKAIRNSKLAAILIPIQIFTFTPLIFFARWNWCARSVAYLLDKTSSAPQLTNVPVELAVIAAHWVIKLSMFFFMDFAKAFTFLMISEAVGGLMIGFMFVLNHNGMHVFTEAEFKEMDFVTLQVLTSRDIKSNVFTDFFSGGLNYQVEHHLFPAMPRHHFHKVAPLVDRLCQKHGIPVHRVSFWAGVKEFWASLEVSQDCVKNNKYEVPRHPLPHYGKSQ